MCWHKSSLLVVGPTQCGKTRGLKTFSERIVFFTRARNRGEYIWRYYSQWQDSYKVIQSSIGKEIQFIRGLPEFKEDLREVDPKFNNVLVFDDLMAQATDSSLFSLLFTQGRHRNANVILLPQNMFPKRKFNKDISRMLSTWLFSEVLAIENKSVSLPNTCLTKIARESCELIFKKQKERLVISSLIIDQTHRVISKYWVTFSALVVDIRLLTASRNQTKQSVKTTNNKENIACEARSSVASCSQVFPANCKKVTVISFWFSLV